MLRNRKQRQRFALAGIVALATLLGAYFAQTELLEGQLGLQTAVSDFVINAAPARVRNQITIIALDDAVIDRYGPWPVPRQAYIDLLQALKPHTPKIVAFDIALYDPSEHPDQDKALAAAIKDSGNVILAMQGAGLGEYREDKAQHYQTLKFPLDIFRAGALALGSVNVNADPDSRVRSAQLVVKGPDGTAYYALPLVASARHLSGDLATVRITDAELILPTKQGERNLPIDRGGAMRVYYAGPPHPPAERVTAGTKPCAESGIYCVVSMVDVVDGKIPKELLQFRSIYVGAFDLSAVPDNYPVPTSESSKMWGVEIHANTAQSIFTNRYPVPHQSLPITVLEILVLSLAGVYLIDRFRLVGFLLSLGLLAGFSFVMTALFVLSVDSPVGTGGVNVPSLAYLAPSVFWWVVALGYILVEEQLAVSRTQSTFGRFVTPAVARTIMEKEESGGLRLGGELREITVLFGDIRGFTTISEGMDPHTLLGHLNRYFDGMVAVVTRYQGTVNKYNGDNIMVLWNAPVEVEDHARRAVECALEVQKWIVAERSKGGPDVSFGFGINSGDAVAGFLGASGRMEYTVIGDTVNVASRLTSNDIARRDQVAVSQETLSRLGEDVVAVDLGSIFVKGRAEAVHCFQVDRIGLVANPNPAPPPDVPIGKAAVAGFH
jgi:adenylate cyclase